MRIHDQDHDSSIKNVTLLLTPEEAKQLRGALDSVLREPVASTHLHVDDDAYTHEITVCTYEPEKEHQELAERVRTIIRDDV